MPSINMIAARGAERKRLEKLIRITAVVIVGELALALFILGFMTTRVYSASQRINELDEKLMQVQPTVKKINQYNDEIKLLEPKLELLSASKEQTLLWERVLQNLSRSMPQDTWLSSVSTSTDKQDKKLLTRLDIRGLTASQSLVGETMLRLNQFSDFEKVELNYTKGQDDQKKNVVEFQIGATLAPVHPAKTGGATNENKAL